MSPEDKSPRPNAAGVPCQGWLEGKDHILIPADSTSNLAQEIVWRHTAG